MLINIIQSYVYLYEQFVNLSQQSMIVMSSRLHYVWHDWYLAIIWIHSLFLLVNLHYVTLLGYTLFDSIYTFLFCICFTQTSLRMLIIKYHFTYLLALCTYWKCIAGYLVTTESSDINFYMVGRNMFMESKSVI